MQNRQFLSENLKNPHIFKDFWVFLKFDGVQRVHGVHLYTPLEQTVYHLSYDDASRQSYTCTDPDEGCRRMMCESDKIMIEAFMLYFDDHPNWVPVPTTEAECYREEELGTHSLNAHIIARLNNNIHIEADTCCLSTLQTYVLGLSHCEAGYFYQ